jgi:hypothetical protein
MQDTNVNCIQYKSSQSTSNIFWANGECGQMEVDLQGASYFGKLKNHIYRS